MLPIHYLPRTLAVVYAPNHEISHFTNENGKTGTFFPDGKRAYRIENLRKSVHPPEYIIWLHRWSPIIILIDVVDLWCNAGN